MTLTHSENEVWYPTYLGLSPIDGHPIYSVEDQYARRLTHAVTYAYCNRTQTSIAAPVTAATLYPVLNFYQTDAYQTIYDNPELLVGVSGWVLAGSLASLVTVASFSYSVMPSLTVYRGETLPTEVCVGYPDPEPNPYLQPWGPVLFFPGVSVTWSDTLYVQTSIACPTLGTVQSDLLNLQWTGLPLGWRIDLGIDFGSA